MNVVGRAVHVGARGFPGPRQRIHPALARHVRELALIVGAHRLHRVDRQLSHVGEAVGPVGLHQRRVDVPIAKVGQAEHPPAQLEIALQHRQTAVRLRDQRPIHAFGDVAAVERRLECAVVVPRLGLEQRALDLRAERRAERVLERLVARPELVEDHLAVGAVRDLAGDRIALIIEPHLCAVAELHGRSRNVGRS